MTNIPRLTSVFAWVTKTYSPEFQRVFACDMLALFVLHCEEVRRRAGRIGFTLFVTRTLASVALFGVWDRLAVLLAKGRTHRKFSLRSRTAGMISRPAELRSDVVTGT